MRYYLKLSAFSINEKLMIGILTGKVKIFFELLVVTIVSYFLADACYSLLFVEQAELPKTAIRTVSSNATAQKQIARNTFNMIEQRNLLKVQNVPHIPKPVLAPKPPPVEALSISKRGFHLLGTIYADIPSQSWAIVLYKNKQSLYKIGTSVGGWKIASIKRREIILQRKDMKERLLIDATGKGAVAQVGTNIHERVLARKYVKNELKDLDKIAQSIQLEPKQVAQSKGLQVSSLRTKSFFYNMGLRKGDLLVQANGKVFASLSDAASLMSMLDNNNISLDIIRKGKRQTLTYRLVN